MTRERTCKWLVAVLCALLFAVRADAATQPTTSTLTVTSNKGLNPYGLTCSVVGEAVSGVLGPTGSVTFTDTTTGQTLASGPLGGPTQARSYVPTSTFQNSFGFVVGDFNGDGFQDLAVDTGTGNDLYVYLGNGDGTFQSPKITAGIGEPVAEYDSVWVGDFNGDGNEDLLELTSVAEPNTFQLTLFLGNGDGTFQTTGIPETTVQINEDESFLYVVGDFNGDHIDDLATSDGSNIQIFLGSSSGVFDSTTNYSLGSATEVEDVVTGDFRGNGMLDLALSIYDESTNTYQLFMLLGNGDGTFQTPVAYLESGGVGGLATGYFNNDGFLDLAVLTGDGLGLVLGNGDGTLQSGIVNVGGGTLSLGPPYAGFFGNAGSPSPGLLSIDDTCIGCDEGETANVVIFAGNGNATFRAPETFVLPPYFNGHFAVTEFTGDGYSDFVTWAANYDYDAMAWVYANVIVYENQMQSTAGAAANVTIPADAAATHDLECSYPGDANYAASTSQSVAITFSQAQTPLFSLNVGSYISAQNISISDSSPGVTIYYTTDGSTPSTNSARYTAPIYITTTTTLKAIAAGTSYLTSAVSEAVYTLTDPPAFSVPGGTYTTAQSVALSDPTADATIYYTTDGTTPGQASTQYTNPITVAGTETISATALAPGGLFSPVVTVTYTLPPVVTNTALKTSTTSGMVNQAITLTATVTGDQPTGSVTFSAGSATLGTAIVTAGVASLQTSFAAAGTYTVTASYSGDSNNGASVSNAITVTIVVVSSSTTLSASATSANENQQIKLTAKVTGSQPTGSVTFSAGSTTLGTATVTAGVATVQTSFATAGTYTVSATYSGDAVNAASTSSTLTITIAAPSYAVSSSPTSRTISAGQTATFALSVTPAGGYAGTVKFTCGTLPTEASCAFTPSSVAITGSAAGSTSLTISTTAPTSSSDKAPANPFGPLSAAGGTALAGIIALAFAPGRTRRWNRTSRGMLYIGLLAAVWFPLAGCGGGGNGGGGGGGNPGTPSGTYSVSVTAADSTGGESNAVNVTLVIQ